MWNSLVDGAACSDNIESGAREHAGRHSIPAAPMLILELQTKLREAFRITKKSPNMKSFKNLC